MQKYSIIINSDLNDNIIITEVLVIQQLLRNTIHLKSKPKADFYNELQKPFALAN